MSSVAPPPAHRAQRLRRVGGVWASLPPESRALPGTAGEADALPGREPTLSKARPEGVSSRVVRGLLVLGLNPSVLVRAV